MRATGRRSGGVGTIGLLATVLVLSACGTGGAPATADPTPLPASMEESGDQINLNLTRDERGVRAEYDASADEVWSLLPAVYADLQIEPDVVETAGRRFGSANVTGLRVAGEPMHELMRCGAQATGLQTTTRMRVKMTVISTVEPLGANRSAVTTRITGTGSRIDGTSTGSIACVSTGRLEERIAGLIRLAVATSSVSR